MDFALFRSILEQLSCATFIWRQGCALAEPAGPWRLTFALRRLENLIFLYSHMLGTLDFTVHLEHSCAPFNFP